MDDFSLVLNAGSSSVKFCVFRRPAREVWRLDARGQIEGIGTSPRLSAKSAPRATRSSSRKWPCATDAEPLMRSLSG